MKKIIIEKISRLKILKILNLPDFIEKNVKNNVTNATQFIF